MSKLQDSFLSGSNIDFIEGLYARFLEDPSSVDESWRAFFEQYGGKAVVLGRFVPIVRTFVPFVAGAAQMSSPSFVFYNIVGAVAWVCVCLGAGWLFGNVPVVKENFSLVTIGIVFVSVLPVIVEYIRHRRSG